MNESDTSGFMRGIRTFVRRQGRMSGTLQQALEQHWQHYGIDISHAAGQIQPHSYFSRQAELHLEIGFGNGNTFVNLARSHPQHNYLGIEVHRPGLANVCGLGAQYQMTNIRIINADAQEVLRHHIADETFSAMYIFFPDPWPKQRHQKRRLIQTEFAQILAQKLKPSGQLYLATDWEDYAVQMLRVLDAISLLENQAGRGQFSSRPEMRALTKYEQRGVRRGHVVRDLRYIRK